MENNAPLLETHWSQVENCLWLFDATGADAVNKPGIQKIIVINIERTIPNQRFSLINKGHRIALLLPQHELRNKAKNKDTLHEENPGAEITQEQLRVTAAELAHGAPLIAHIEGILIDPTRQFNSRWFARDLQALDMNHLERNAIGLFRHTQAISLGGGGSLRGQLQLETGVALPWAILVLRLQLQAPQPKPVIELQTQANQFGEFIVSLADLPALEFDMPIQVYSAQLRIARCAIKSGLPDPDDVESLEVLALAPQGENPEFVEFISFQIKPGEHQHLYSHEQTALLVKPSG